MRSLFFKMLIILGGTEPPPAAATADVAEADQPCKRLSGGVMICVVLDQCFLNLMCIQITWGCVPMQVLTWEVWNGACNSTFHQAPK